MVHNISIANRICISCKIFTAYGPNIINNLAGPSEMKRSLFVTPLISLFLDLFLVRHLPNSWTPPFQPILFLTLSDDLLKVDSLFTCCWFNFLFHSLIVSDIASLIGTIQTDHEFVKIWLFFVIEQILDIVLIKIMLSIHLKYICIILSNDVYVQLLTFTGFIKFHSNFTAG